MQNFIHFIDNNSGIIVSATMLILFFGPFFVFSFFKERKIKSVISSLRDMYRLRSVLLCREINFYGDEKNFDRGSIQLTGELTGTTSISPDRRVIVLDEEYQIKEVYNDTDPKLSGQPVEKLEPGLYGSILFELKNVDDYEKFRQKLKQETIIVAKIQ